jgi:UDP-N-acetylglucosamine acyltransferase
MSSVSADARIHPTAAVEDGAQIGPGTEIGPFCSISSETVIGANVRLVGHVCVLGVTEIGDGTEVWPNTVLGGPPQNKAHRGGRTTLTIGRNNVIREFVTMNAGTDGSRGATTVGDNGYFMAYSHIAHDCDVGNGVTFANQATLGGHCVVGDGVIIGGLTAVHQFNVIGHHAFLGGCSAVVGDVIPYGMATGNRAKLRGLNVVGLKRSGVKRSEITAMRQALKLLFDQAGPMRDNAALVLEQFPGNPTVAEIVEFATAKRKRYLVVPPGVGGRADEADSDE